MNKGASKQRRSLTQASMCTCTHIPGPLKSRQCSKPLRHLSSPRFIFLKKDSSTIQLINEMLGMAMSFSFF